MDDTIEMMLRNIQEFIRINNKDRNFMHVSKVLLSGVDSIGVQLPEYNKEYSIIVEDGVVSAIEQVKKNNHAFTLSVSTSLVSKLISLAYEKNYLALIKEAHKLEIPLKYKLRFGKLCLTSSYELDKCKEMVEKHNFS